MTQREYAADLISILSDEQVQTLINLITTFSDSSTEEKIKQAQHAALIKSKRESMERLKKIIKKVPVDDEKETMRKFREEKYGN